MKQSMMKNRPCKMNLKLPFIKRKKDWTPGSDDYKEMLAANVARNEESGVSNSNWAPGALRRLKNKERVARIKDWWATWWHN
jgi:hypothetical protein